MQPCWPLSGYYVWATGCHRRFKEYSIHDQFFFMNCTFNCNSAPICLRCIQLRFGRLLFLNKSKTAATKHCLVAKYFRRRKSRICAPVCWCGTTTSTARTALCKISTIRLEVTGTPLFIGAKEMQATRSTGGHAPDSIRRLKRCLRPLKVL